MQNTQNLCMGCMNDKGSDSVCSVCGFDAGTYNKPDSLPLKTMLAGRYVVGRVISDGGEGFTYIGFDAVTESVVKINEYFPAGLTKRDTEGKVIIDGARAFAFNEGVIKFIELYKKLGMLSEVSAISRVLDIFETNKTAYAISEYLPGIRLKEFLLRNGGVLSWEQVRPLFLPLVSAIKVLHDNGIIHGGISPETLTVGRDGKIRITDFCISELRNAKSDMQAQLFAGYAAIEQYKGEDITPATDVYAFAATMFRTLTGNPPPEATQRVTQDSLTFPKSIAESMPRKVLVTMANALQISPADRTATMEEFKSDLQGGDTSVKAAAVVKKESLAEDDGIPAKKSSTAKYVLIASLITALIIAIIGFLLYNFLLKDDGSSDASSNSSKTASVSSVASIVIVEDEENGVELPDFTGKTFADINGDDEIGRFFDVRIVRKEYNKKYAKGTICGQIVAPGTKIQKNPNEDIVVEVILSMGPEEFSVPKSLIGKTEQEARIILYELGFESNTVSFKTKQGEPTTEKVVMETYPKIGSKIKPYDNIIVYINENIVVESSEPQYPDYGYGDYDYGYGDYNYEDEQQ